MQFASVTFLSDKRSDLQKVTVPSLTLQCTDDIIVPLELGYFINEHMKDKTLVLMKASDHCEHMSAPDETIKAIKLFIN